MLYTNNKFCWNSSSVLVTTELNKRAIEKNDGNVGIFLLGLFNGKLYPSKITLKLKDGCIVDCF